MIIQTISSIARTLFEYGISLLVLTTIIGAVAAGLFLPWAVSYRVFCYFREERVGKRPTFICLLTISIFVSVVYPTFSTTSSGHAFIARVIGLITIIFAIWDYLGYPRLFIPKEKPQN